MKQRRPMPQVALSSSTSHSAAPAVEPTPASGMGLMDLELSSMLSTATASLTGAKDWVETVRRLGPTGSVVVDALPLEVSLPRIHELCDLPFIRSFVLDLDPRVVARLAPTIALDMLDEVWPVGVGLGLEAQVLTSERFDGLRATQSLESHCEAFRLGPDSTQIVGGIEAVVGVRSGLGEADGPNEVGFTGKYAVSVDYTETLATNPFELPVAACRALRGEAPGPADVVTTQLRELSGVQPEIRIGLSACASASFLEPDQLDEVIPDFLFVPLDWFYEMRLNSALGPLLRHVEATVGGELIIPPTGCIQVLCRLGAESETPYQLGQWDGLPIVDSLCNYMGPSAGEDGALSAEVCVDTGVETIEELKNGVLAPGTLPLSLVYVHLSRTIGETCDTLEFYSTSKLEEFLRAPDSNPVGDRMSDALRNCGIEVYRRSVRRPLSADSPLVPGGLAGLFVEDGDLELVLEAAVDARALADAFERGPSDSMPGLLPKLSPVDAIEAVFGLLKGERPPAWFGIDTSLLRSAVEVPSARVQGVVDREKRKTTVLDDDESKLNPSAMKHRVKPGPLSIFTDDHVERSTESHMDRTGTATIRVDQEVAVSTRILWEAV